MYKEPKNLQPLKVMGADDEPIMPGDQVIFTAKNWADLRFGIYRGFVAKPNPYNNQHKTYRLYVEEDQGGNKTSTSYINTHCLSTGRMTRR